MRGDDGTAKREKPEDYSHERGLVTLKLRIKQNCVFCLVLGRNRDHLTGARSQLPRLIVYMRERTVYTRYTTGLWVATMRIHGGKSSRFFACHTTFRQYPTFSNNPKVEI